MIMNEIKNPELNEIVVSMDMYGAHSEEGNSCLLIVLEKNVLPNTYLKLAKLCRKCKWCEKILELSWDQYIKKLKKSKRNERI